MDQVGATLGGSHVFCSGAHTGSWWGEKAGKVFKMGCGLGRCAVICVVYQLFLVLLCGPLVALHFPASL